LIIVDPKALNHILQSSAYNYVKPVEAIDFAKLILGREGIVIAEGALSFNRGIDTF
jgi:hypothetical protein